MDIQKIYKIVKDSKRMTNSLKKYEEYIKDYYGITLSQKLYSAINNLVDNPKCSSCDNDVEYLSFHGGYRDFCSGSCAQTSQKTRDKREDTLFKRYGTTDSLSIKNGRERGNYKCNNNLEISQKRVETCLNKYGGETPFHSQDIQNKIKNTIFEKHGVKNVMFCEDTKIKHKISIKSGRVETNLEKYGVVHPAQTDWYQKKYVVLMKIMEDGYLNHK